MDTIDELKQIRQRVNAQHSEHLEKTTLGWRSVFNERQRRLIASCCTYADNYPADLTGHDLMLIIAQMAEILDGCVGRGN